MLWDEERRRRGDCMQQGRRGKEVLYSASEVYAAEVFWQFMWRASRSRSLCLQRCHGRLRCRTQFGRASTKRHCAALTVLLLLDRIVCSHIPLSYSKFPVSNLSLSFLSPSSLCVTSYKPNIQPNTENGFVGYVSLTCNEYVFWP